MDVEALQRIQQERMGSETVIWAGRPAVGIRFRPGDWFAVPFSLVWCGFAIFWELGVAASPKAPPFMLVFGGFFIAIGLYMVVGRFFVDSYKRSKTYYGITNQRAISVCEAFGRKVVSESLRTLGTISTSGSPTGLGSLSFGNRMPQGNMPKGFAWPGVDEGLAFDFIQNPKQVHETIVKAQQTL